MYEEPEYFDPHDPHHMAGAGAEAVHNPSICSSLPQFMGDSSFSHNSLEENLRLSGFSLEDLPNQQNPSDDASAVAAPLGVDLQQQIGYELEHEFNTHLTQEVLPDPNRPPPPPDQPNWNSRVQEVQDINYNHHQQQPHQFPHDQLPQQIGMQHNLQCFNSSTPFASSPPPPYPSTPDLLNLLHLPRCTVSSMLPDSSITFTNTSNKPENYPTSLDFYGEFPSAETVLYDHPQVLHLNLPSQPPLFRELLQSLPHNYSLPGSRGGSFFGGMDEREGTGGGVYQDVDGRQFENSVLNFSREMSAMGKGGEARGTQHFATERQRRQQLNEKYEALRLLVPNPTKTDRASIVGYAIDYIKELLRTVEELKILVDKKRCRRERSKKLKLDDETTTVDMESSSMKSPSTLTNCDQSFNGSLRSSWLQRKSKETEVDVRIIEDEVTIKLIQRKKMNCLLVVSKVLDELQLELLHVAGGNIGDYYSFLFNTKICEGSSVYASAIAKKLIEVVDRQYAAFPLGSF